jgi:hypothetical protein
MDTGKIKADLESAFREVLFSARPAPAKPTAGSAEGHDAAHPRQNGVVVNLTPAAPREAVRAAQQQIAEVRASLPLALAERATVAARDSEVVAKALQAAHTGDAGKVAAVLTRIQEQPAPATGAVRPPLGERIPVAVPAENRIPGAPASPQRLPIDAVAPRTVPTNRETEVLARAMSVAHSGPAATVAQVLGRAEEGAATSMEPVIRNPADAASAQAAPARTPGLPLQPQALPANPVPDANMRADAQAAHAAMMVAGAMTSAQAPADPAKAASAASASRTHPELIAPMLVRQQPPEEAPAPYLNQIIIGAAFLGLVILLVM